MSKHTQKIMAKQVVTMDLFGALPLYADQANLLTDRILPGICSLALPDIYRPVGR